jgi:hypothetical protein
MSTSGIEETRQTKAKTVPEAYPAEKARQGVIILNTRLRRIIFLTGLFGGLVLLVLLGILLSIGA